MAKKTNDILITLHASAPRRAFAGAVLFTLGALLLFMSFRGAGDSYIIKAFLGVMGVGSIYLMTLLWQATSVVLELTESELRSSTGEVLARVDEMERLDRGTFAFKPSNGFIVILDTPGPRRWQPGMWWRTGRRIGIGGVTSAPNAKAMAEVIAAMIAERRPKG